MIAVLRVILLLLCVMGIMFGLHQFFLTQKGVFLFNASFFAVIGILCSIGLKGHQHS